MARDVVHGSSAVAGKRDMAIEIRDAAGPVMQVKFTFEIESSKH
jgi:hypothetical protein